MITGHLARFVAETAYSDIPKEARLIARLAITDFLGVALAGSKEKTGCLIIEYVKSMGGAPLCTVIGSDFKVSPYLAALANGTLGHILNLDDVSFTVWQGHPSVCLAPPLLALGESTGASGAEIITAYVIGFEAGACLHSELGQSQLAKGWHGTSVLGSVAAGAAASRLLKLNVQQVRMTLGIAASLASGLMQNRATMTKPLHAGHAASNGVMAALLAQQGFTANDSIIEAPKGYARMFGFDGEVDWEKASKSLGKDFIITIPAHEFKPYPTAHCTRLVASALALRNQYKINPNAISEIIVGVNPGDAERESQFPKDGLQAQFSIRYCVSRALLDGRFDISGLADEQVNQPEVQRLMKLARFVGCYPGVTIGGKGKRSPQSITIKLKNGMEYSDETPARARQMTVEEIENKYRDCASLVLSGKEVEVSLKLLKSLDELQTIRELIGILAKT